MASSKTSIYSALGANIIIFITKFIAGALSNSTSMISEGIHSLVDTANQLLLLLGIRRSQKKPDDTHPFGYGKELYFYSFIVSLLIFGMGGGVSIYQGIVHLIKPEPLEDPTINYIVLGVSLVFEGFSFAVALKEFNRARNKTPWWQAIVRSKDPSTFLVLFEDAAAVIGLSIVFICVYLSHLLQLPFLDGLGSLLVGIVLICVSTILARESRSLLMGEGVTKDSRVRIKILAESNSAIQQVVKIFSTYQSPTEVILMIVAEFKQDLNTEMINIEIENIRAQIKSEFKVIKFVLIQPSRASEDFL